MKNSRSLSYLAEYQYGEDNLLTATYQEQRRLRNEDRLRNAQSALRLEDLAISDSSATVNNAKKLQQQLDQKGVVDRDNALLLHKLEQIHNSVPSQFDVSHHSRAVLDAPRATNEPRRRREHERIELENREMERRLRRAKGTFSNKQLAADADRHQYLSDQISKVERRQKVRQKCRSMATNAAIRQESLVRADDADLLDNHRWRDRNELAALCERSPVNTLPFPAGGSPTKRRKDPTSSATASDRYQPLPILLPHVSGVHGSPTLHHTTKLITAKDLFRKPF